MGAILSLFSPATPPTPQQAVEKKVADYGKSLDRRIAKRQKSIVENTSQAKKQVEQEAADKQQAIEKTVSDPVVKKALQEEAQKVQMFKTSLIAKRADSDEKVRQAEQAKADAKKAALMQQLKLLQARRAEALKKRQAAIAKAKAAQEAAMAAAQKASAQTPEQKAAAEKAMKENEAAIAAAKKVEADAKAARKEQEKKTADAEKKLNESIKKEEKAQRAAEEKDKKDRAKYNKQIADAKAKTDREIREGREFDKKGADYRRTQDAKSKASQKSMPGSRQSAKQTWKQKLEKRERERKRNTAKYIRRRLTKKDKDEFKKCKTVHAVTRPGYMGTYCKGIVNKFIKAQLVPSNVLIKMIMKKVKGIDYPKSMVDQMKRRSGGGRKRKRPSPSSRQKQYEAGMIRRCGNRNYLRRNKRKCEKFLKKLRSKLGRGGGGGMKYKGRTKPMSWWKRRCRGWAFSRKYRSNCKTARLGPSPSRSGGGGMKFRGRMYPLSWWKRLCRRRRFKSRNRTNCRKAESGGGGSSPPAYMSRSQAKKILKKCRNYRYKIRNNAKCKQAKKRSRPSVTFPSAAAIAGASWNRAKAKPPPKRKKKYQLPRSYRPSFQKSRPGRAGANLGRSRPMSAMQRRRSRSRSRGRGRCFSEYTKVTLASGETKCIKDISLGEQLEGGILVDATMQIKNRTNDPFYRIKSDALNDYVYVTGTHHILHGDKYIQVSEHPDAEITDKCDMILYCLVTSTHTIPVGEITFWDWEDDLVKA
jgi:hypothetical protein